MGFSKRCDWVGTIFDVVVGGAKENLSFDHFQKELFLHMYIQDKFDIFPEENPAGLKQHQIFINFFYSILKIVHCRKKLLDYIYSRYI